MTLNNAAARLDSIRNNVFINMTSEEILELKKEVDQIGSAMASRKNSKLQMTLLSECHHLRNKLLSYL